MTDTTFSQETAFVVGPPAAGKTSIGRAVAQSIGAHFHTIDDWTSYVYVARRQSGPMSDEQIDEALSLLFQNATWNGSIYEFAYHDYVGLLRRNFLPKFGSSKKIIVVASLDTCQARNEERPSAVPNVYVERAWQSTQALIDLCSEEDACNALIVDTTLTTVGAVVPSVVKFLTTRRQANGNARSIKSSLSVGTARH
jgi:hypothetical protein